MSFFRSTLLCSLVLLNACAAQKGDDKPAPAPVKQTPVDPCALGKTAVLNSSLASLTADTTTAPESDAKNVGRIAFDNGLSSKERGAFVAAFDYLDGSPRMDAEPELLRYMGIRSFDHTEVRQWLEDRIQYIIPGNADSSKIRILDTNYRNFENPGQVPPAIAPCLAKDKVAEAKGQVVMSNIGALLYLLGKAEHKLVGVLADGMGTIRMTSARAGVLQVGEGLFMINEQFPNLVKIFHLTTLIHESRHSDGNGVHTGFFHENCLTGDYAGRAACDHNLNGPYEIEAMAIYVLKTNCAACSTKEKQLLNILYLDTAGRRIDDATTTEWDDRPEGHR